MPTRVNKIQKKSGIYRLYLYYCYRLGYLPKYKKQNTVRLHYYLKEDLLKIDQISKETRLLARENISTDKQLFSYMDSLTKKIETLRNERDELRKLSRRNLSKDDKSKIKDDISNVSEKIKELQTEVNLCDDIATRSKVIEERVKQIEIDEEKNQRKEKKLNEQFR